MQWRWLVSGLLPILACASAAAADPPDFELLAGTARWEAAGTTQCVWLPAGERPIELLLVRSDAQGRSSLLVLDHLYAFELQPAADGGFTTTAIEGAVPRSPPRRLQPPSRGQAGKAALAFSRAGDVCDIAVVLPADLASQVDAHDRAAAHARLRAVESVARRMAEANTLLRAKADAKAALAPAQDALQQATDRLGRDHPLTASAAADLGSVYWNLGLYDKAREAAEAAIATFTRREGPDGALTLDVRKNAALYAWELGNLAGARVEFERVRPLIVSRFGERSNAALAVTSNLAALYLEAGLVHESLEMFSVVYLAREARDGPADRRTLVALNNLAHAHSKVGRTDDARQLLELSFERHRSALGARHPDTLLAHHNVAAARCQGPVSECPELTEVAQLRAEVLGTDHPDTLQSQGLLGAFLLKHGKPGEALPLLQAVYEGRAKKMSPRHALTLTSQANVAHARALTNDAATGPRQMRDVLADMDAIIGPTNPLTLASYASLARLCERLSRPECRREALQVVVDRAESERGLVLLHGQQQVTATRQWVPLYRALAWMQAQDGDVASALRTIERSKGRGLMASLGLKQAERSGGLPPDVIESIAARERELAALDNERLRTADAQRITQIDVRQSAIASELAAQRAGLRARYPRYAAATEIDVPDARELARPIARDEIFVGYATLEDGFLVYTAESGGKLDIRFVRLPHAASAVDAWRAAVGMPESVTLWRLPDGAFHAGEQPPAPGARQVQPADVAEYLAAPLLGVASERLVRYRRWIISPDGPLATVPFETLPWQGKPLADSVDVRYAQSLAVYRLLRQRTAAGQTSLFAMGGPTFGRPPAAEASAAGQLADKFSLRGRANDVSTLMTRSADDPEATRKAYAALRAGWTPLPAAEREVKAVAALFPGATVFTGDDASEERLQQLEARGELARYRYLLFATHGYLSMDAPALSAVVLRQPGSASVDGYVTAAEWAGYTLRSDLIVLSACETGLGKEVAGEGVMGLPYALFVAGNRNTLLSLWKVPDASTAEFMLRFFGKLRGGMPQVAALAQTKREMMNSPRYRAPVHWAGFVLYGS